MSGNINPCHLYTKVKQVLAHAGYSIEHGAMRLVHEVTSTVTATVHVSPELQAETAFIRELVKHPQYAHITWVQGMQFYARFKALHTKSERIALLARGI